MGDLNPLATLLRHYASQPGQGSLYAIVDSAANLELAFAAQCLYRQPMLSLFEGDAAPAMADVAPYLVPIQPESDYLERWCQCWGEHVGILVISPADLEALYPHLRKNFVATDESGQEYFFRYYDPRVLRAYLPTCTPAEIDEFFGPVQAIICEGEQADLVSFYLPQREDGERGLAHYQRPTTMADAPR